MPCQGATWREFPHWLEMANSNCTLWDWKFPLIGTTSCAAAINSTTCRRIPRTRSLVTVALAARLLPTPRRSAGQRGSLNRNYKQKCRTFPSRLTRKTLRKRNSHDSNETLTRRPAAYRNSPELILRQRYAQRRKSTSQRQPNPRRRSPQLLKAYTTG